MKERRRITIKRDYRKSLMTGLKLRRLKSYQLKANPSLNFCVRMDLTPKSG